MPYTSGIDEFGHGFSVFDIEPHRYVIFGAAESTGDAYDITQTHDAIHDGDILLVPSESVVGVMVQAWPTAVSEQTGEFHGFAEDVLTNPHPDLAKYRKQIVKAHQLDRILNDEKQQAA